MRTIVTGSSGLLGRHVAAALVAAGHDVTGIDTVAKAHANFKRAVTWPHESGFRYVFHSSGDKNRELTMTVLVFHVPK